MARFYFPSDNLLVASGAGTPAAITLAPSAAFTMWSAESGGSQYTDLKAADGTTDLPTSGGAPFCDLTGKPPPMWGPDGVREMWRQLGASVVATGARFPVYPQTDLIDSLTNGARKNVANTFTQPATFTSGSPTAFTVAPTVSGNAVAHAGNLPTLLADVPTMIALLNAVGWPWFILINPTTGVWPNAGARVAPNGASLTTLTTRVIWDSQSYIGALEPAGLIDGDFWDERLA